MSQNLRRNSVAGADSRGAALAEFGHGIPADNHTQPDIRGATISSGAEMVPIDRAGRVDIHNGSRLTGLLPGYVSRRHLCHSSLRRQSEAQTVYPARCVSDCHCHPQSYPQKCQ